MNKSRYKIEMEALSPIHIGSGNEITPLEYAVKDQNLIRINDKIMFNSNKFDKDAYYNALDNNNLEEIRKFLNIYIQEAGSEEILYRCETSDSFATEYNSKINNTNNQLIVNTLPRNGMEEKAYIPGSSLKGALRTGYIDGIIKASRDKEFANDMGVSVKKNISNFEKEINRYGAREGNLRGIAQRIEKEVLGYKDAKEDPFRALLITDLDISDNNITKVEKIKNTGDKFDKNSRNMSMFYETFKKGTIFTGEFTVNTDCFGKSINRYSFGDNIDMDDFRTLVNAFYWYTFDSESDKFGNDNKITANFYEELENKIDDFDDNTILVRVGRFSHAESVTFSPPFRKILLNNGKFGGTRNYADGSMPLGWAKLTFNKITKQTKKKSKEELDRDYFRNLMTEAYTSNSGDGQRDPKWRQKMSKRWGI